MASVWTFGCKLGLSQSGCQKREHDPSSRGAAQRIGGCASCIYREPASPETAKAEAALEAAEG